MKLLRKLKGKIGFTLVEMLIVIGILSIIMMAAAPGVASYAKRLKLIELDDSARAIYMAAQNKLIAMKSAGTNLVFDGSEKMETIPAYYQNTDEPELPSDPEGGEDVEYHMYFLTSEMSYDLFSETGIVGVSIEGQLYDNNYVIEYDSEKGIVYGVFYAEEDGKAALLAYAPETIQRDFEDRLEPMIGFYGGGTAEPGEKPEEKPEEPPVIEPDDEPSPNTNKKKNSTGEKNAVTVEFDPDGQLQDGKWTDENGIEHDYVEYDKEKVFFSVTIEGYDYRGKEDKYKHKIALISVDDHCYINTVDTDYQSGWSTVVIDSIAPGLGGDTTDEAADGYGWRLPDSRKRTINDRASADGTLYAPIDGYDMSGYIMERDFKGWIYYKYFEPTAQHDSILNQYGNSNEPGHIEAIYRTDSQGYLYPYGYNLPEKWDRFAYTETNFSNDGLKSVYYLIDPGTDIKVTYTFYDYDTLGEVYSYSYNVNSYFGELIGDTKTATITAGRHLQNLALYTKHDLLSLAIIKETIDFSIDHTGLEDAYEYWNSAETNKGTERATNLYDFVPIDNKFVQASTMPTIKADPGVEIRYIRIDSTTYGSTDPSIIPTFKADNYNYTGFITTTKSRYVEDLTFFCPVIIGGGQYTGTIIGKPETGTGVHVNNNTVINPIVVGPGYVGGIAGEWSDSELIGNYVKVEDVYDYFDNYNYSYTNDNTTPSGVNILFSNGPLEDPYAKFGIIGDSSGSAGMTSYAGGLAGRSSVQIKQCYASVRVESDGYSGGLVGLAEGQITKCFTGGHTYRGSYYYNYRGNSGYLINIKGALGAGGVVGKLSGGNVQGCYSTCSVGYLANGNGDTFIGEYVKVNSWDSAEFSGDAKAYAIGWLIDENDSEPIKATSSRWNNVADLNMLLTNNAYSPQIVDAETYDPFLSGEDYPYYQQDNTEVGRFHIGDWPTEMEAPKSVFGVFYWELENGSYNIKYLDYSFDNGDDEDGNLCTKQDGNAVTDFGYGYFYSSNDFGPDDVIVSGFESGWSNYTGGVSGITSAFESFGFEDITVVPMTWSGTNNGNAAVSVEAKNSSTGGTHKLEVYINPYFCAISSANITSYEIRSVEQFKNISKYLGGTFVQTHDLNGGTLTEMIAPFSGSYDGQTYRILNLNIESSASGVGLFGETNGAALKNIILYSENGNNTIVGSNGTSSEYGIGGIVGIANGGSISNCAVAGYTITDSSFGSGVNNGVGGIAGRSLNAQITQCEAVNTIMSDYRGISGSNNISLGGIAGYASGTISECYTGGEININGAFASGIYIGGIVGDNGNSNLYVQKTYSYCRLPDQSLFSINSGDGAIDIVHVHPIAPGRDVIELQGSGVGTADCSYSAYLNGAPYYYGEDDARCRKTYSRDEFAGFLGEVVNSGFGKAVESYPYSPYPFLAVVRNSSNNFVHYGEIPTVDGQEVLPKNVKFPYTGVYSVNTEGKWSDGKWTTYSSETVNKVIYNAITEGSASSETVKNFENWGRSTLGTGSYGVMLETSFDEDGNEEFPLENYVITVSKSSDGSTYKFIPDGYLGRTGSFDETADAYLYDFTSLLIACGIDTEADDFTVVISYKYQDEKKGEVERQLLSVNKSEFKDDYEILTPYAGVYSVLAKKGDAENTRYADAWYMDEDGVFGSIKSLGSAYSEKEVAAQGEIGVMLDHRLLSDMSKWTVAVYADGEKVDIGALNKQGVGAVTSAQINYFKTKTGRTSEDYEKYPHLELYSIDITELLESNEELYEVNVMVQYEGETLVNCIVPIRTEEKTSDELPVDMPYVGLYRVYDYSRWGGTNQFVKGVVLVDGDEVYLSEFDDYNPADSIDPTNSYGILVERDHKISDDDIIITIGDTKYTDLKQGQSYVQGYRLTELTINGKSFNFYPLPDSVSGEFEVDISYNGDTWTVSSEKADGIDLSDYDFTINDIPTVGLFRVYEQYLDQWNVYYRGYYRTKDTKSGVITVTDDTANQGGTFTDTGIIGIFGSNLDGITVTVDGENIELETRQFSYQFQGDWTFTGATKLCIPESVYNDMTESSVIIVYYKGLEIYRMPVKVLTK